MKNLKAPVTPVEYGGYECPYCGRSNKVMMEGAGALGGERSGMQGAPWVFIARQQYDGPRDAASPCVTIEQAGNG